MKCFHHVTDTVDLNVGILNVKSVQWSVCLDVYVELGLLWMLMEDVYPKTSVPKVSPVVVDLIDLIG